MSLPDKFLRGSNRGVSPVIGIVLMVGITVLLAAAMAAFVLGMGTSTGVAPYADWQFSYADNNLTVTHGGGDPVDGSAVLLMGQAIIEEDTLDDVHPGRWHAGTSGTVKIDPAVDDRTIRLVFAPGGGDRTILAEWVIPDG